MPSRKAGRYSHQGERMRSINGSIILIVVGLFFLLSNFGIISIDALKNLLATWWPLVLIAVGVAGILRRKG